MGQKKEVTILQDGTVNTENCELEKDKGDEVRWKSNYGPWKVRFNGGSPFRDSDFDVPAGGHSNWSGAPTGAKRQYPYDVKTGAGAAVADPNIIIK